tara:strand:+ start:9200 stop:9487 length:288 start_codon:yes stop_codon:yes gene_type:complete
MTIKEIIEDLEIAGYKTHYAFPDDFYVKEFINDENQKRYIIITIHQDYGYDPDPVYFQISLASDDWMEPIEISHHNKECLEDTIYHANRTKLNGE